MSNRTNEKGFPYSNDHVKVAAIASVIAERLIEAVDPGYIEPTPLGLAIEAHAEYDGLRNSEFWLSVMRASAALQDHAFEKFTHLVTDRDEDQD